MWIGKGKDIFKQIIGGEDIARAIALQMRKLLYEAVLDTWGWLEWVNFELEVSCAVSICSDDDTASTKESDHKFDSE